MPLPERKRVRLPLDFTWDRTSHGAYLEERRAGSLRGIPPFVRTIYASRITISVCNTEAALLKESMKNYLTAIDIQYSPSPSLLGLAHHMPQQDKLTLALAFQSLGRSLQTTIVPSAPLALFLIAASSLLPHFEHFCRNMKLMERLQHAIDKPGAAV